MPLYDRYSKVMKGHGPFIQRMEKIRQERILDWIQFYLRKSSSVHVLEVGVGIGLFATACRRHEWSYTGIDRNEKIAAELGSDLPVLAGEVPPLPASVEPGSFDLAYSSFVFEHLADGMHGFEFARELCRALKPEGILVLVVPDARSLGLEFWNLDYIPTAIRQQIEM